jgi:hypothetical protein
MEGGGHVDMSATTTVASPPRSNDGGATMCQQQVARAVGTQCCKFVRVPLCCLITSSTRN